MGVTFYRIHVEHRSESRRKTHDYFHQLLIADFGNLRGGVSLQSSCSFQFVAHFQRILFSQVHQRCGHEDLSCPSFKRTLSLVAVQTREQSYEPILQNIFSYGAVTNISHAHRKHTGRQTVVQDFLGDPVAFSA